MCTVADTVNRGLLANFGEFRMIVDSRLPTHLVWKFSDYRLRLLGVRRGQVLDFHINFCTCPHHRLWSSDNDTGAIVCSYISSTLYVQSQSLLEQKNCPLSHSEHEAPFLNGFSPFQFPLQHRHIFIGISRTGLLSSNELNCAYQQSYC